MLSKAFFHVVNQFVLPHLPETVEVSAESDQADYVQVENRGSDVTIFCFAGQAVLYAAMPRFEFRRLLDEDGSSYNLVFFRDVHRTCYHMSPSGAPDGLEFYEARIRDLMGELKSRHYVALGASAGGSAAIYFGTRLGLNHAIAFSPAFPLDVYTTGHPIFDNYLNLYKLVTRPGDYLENTILVPAAYWTMMRLAATVGEDKVWDPVGTYLNAEAPPRLTLFYGAKCRPDAKQAGLFGDHPHLVRRPLPSGRHNCPVCLKQQGILGKTILEEIKQGIAFSS